MRGQRLRLRVLYWYEAHLDDSLGLDQVSPAPDYHAVPLGVAHLVQSVEQEVQVREPGRAVRISEEDRAPARMEDALASHQLCSDPGVPETAGTDVLDGPALAPILAQLDHPDLHSRVLQAAALRLGGPLLRQTLRSRRRAVFRAIIHDDHFHPALSPALHPFSRDDP